MASILGHLSLQLGSCDKHPVNSQLSVLQTLLGPQVSVLNSKSL